MTLLHPLPGARVTQRFGANPDWYEPTYEGHEGIDYSAVVGTPVRAAHDGTAYTRTSSGYGNYIELMGAGMRTVYAHLSEVLSTGPVKAGDVIALTGNTGRTTGPHLHFGVCPLPRNWGNGYQGYVDPEPWIMAIQEERMSKWKIWPHFQGHVETPVPGRPGSHEWQELMASPGMICTQINAYEYGRENPCPGTTWIERLWIGGDCLETEMMWKGAKGADLMWQRHILPALKATSPDGDPTKSWLHTGLWGNEPQDILKFEFLAPFNAYNMRAAELMHSVGKEAWLGKISVGQPHEDYFVHLIPSTNAADVWVTHAYGAPTMQTEARWYALRHEMWIDAIERAGGKVPDWFFGELGIDGGVLNNAQHPFKDEQLGWWKKGWRDWESWNFERGRPSYKEQLIWFNDQIQHPRFRGGNTFIHIPMDVQWQSWDHDGEMTSWMAAKHRAAPERPPAVVEPWLPSTDAATLEAVNGGDLATMQDKVRWWTEEAVRQIEGGGVQRGLEILRDMVQVDGGLMYEAERAAKRAD